MRFNAENLRLRLVSLVTVMSWLSACATVSSERTVGVCPPVGDYSRAFQARAVDVIAWLPERSAIAEMLADYIVMRGQARACRV